MALLLFYFPGVGTQNDPAAWFRNAGLGDLIAEGDATPQFVQDEVSGPDKRLGRLAFWDEQVANPQPRIPQIDLERQTWYEAPKRGELPAGRVWIGWYSDQPVTPADLLRKKPLQGREVELGPYTWLVPTARALPTVFSFDRDGQPVWNCVNTRHVQYAERARELALKMKSEKMQFDFDPHLRFTEQALQMNYRVTLEVLDLMKAIHSDVVCVPCFVASGIPVDKEDYL